MAKEKKLNKKTFTVEIGGIPSRVAVIRPSVKVRSHGQLIFNQAFKEAVNAGSLLRADVEKIMAKSGSWDEAKRAEYQEQVDKLLKAERKLAGGKLKLSEAKELAIQMRRDRNKLNQLSSERNNLDLTTAEAFAENARFYYYVAECTIYEDSGEKVFASSEDYTNRTDEEVAQKSAEYLGQILYNLDENYDEKLPENQFLRKYKFADQSLHLVNKKGQLVNSTGHLINEDGRLINDAGQFVDKDGNLIDEDGNYIVDFEPFLDDDGNPVDENGNVIAPAPVNNDSQ